MKVTKYMVRGMGMKFVIVLKVLLSSVALKPLTITTCQLKKSTKLRSTDIYFKKTTSSKQLKHIAFHIIFHDTEINLCLEFLPMLGGVGWFSAEIICFSPMLTRYALWGSAKIESKRSAHFRQTLDIKVWHKAKQLSFSWRFLKEKIPNNKKNYHSQHLE